MIYTRIMFLIIVTWALFMAWNTPDTDPLLTDANGGLLSLRDGVR